MKFQSLTCNGKKRGIVGKRLMVVALPGKRRKRKTPEAEMDGQHQA